MATKLHIYFFPYMASGHMIPLVDMARQFARHDNNVKTTILLTHVNAPQFLATIEKDRQQGLDINIRQLTLPTAQVGLPDDFTGLGSVTSQHMYTQFYAAIRLLRQPVEQLLREDKPDCIVSDFFVSWVHLGFEPKIPNIVFHVCGFFPICLHHSMNKHKPHTTCGGPDTFVVPGLPHVVTWTKRQLSNSFKDCPESEIMEYAIQGEAASYGVIFNTFKEMEPGYPKHYRTEIRSKAWHVGPVSLCNEDIVDKARRGDDNNNGIGNKKVHCLDWLSTKEPNSVVYISFGTLAMISTAQLREIAIGLESSGRDFIWVVKGARNIEEWLPEGFEERVQKRGLMVKTWAPQVLILEHESVGGFLTHCGWNSLLEGVTAGKPVITWPISAEQFENEKLATEILKVGVSVGNLEWSDRLDVQRGLIKGEKIAEAVNKVMVGGEGVEMRNRARKLSDEAKKAVEKGGSSYNDLDSLLEELRLNKTKEINVV